MIQVDERHLQARRHLAHRFRVARQLAIARVDVDVHQVRELLVRDRRDQREARSRRAVVAGLLLRLDVGLEVLLELRQPGFPVERFVQPEERQDDVGFLLGELLRRVDEVERTRLQRERVAAPAEVPDGELQVRMTRHQLRLEVVEVLHPLGERVADQHDAIVRLQLERKYLGSARRAGAGAGAAVWA